MKRIAQFFAAIFLSVGWSTATHAALASLVHALPPLPNAIPASNPVDIAINGKCEYHAKPFGAKIGPKKTNSGEYTVLFYEAKESDPCRGQVLAEITLDIEETDEVDIVLGLDQRDLVKVHVWDNRDSLDEIEDGISPTVVEVRNVAASSRLEAVLTVEGEEAQSVMVKPGRGGLMNSEPGKASLRVKKGGETLDLDRGKLKSGAAHWVYITGSQFRSTIELLTLRAVPRQRPIPDQNTRPDDVTPEYSSCCLFGVCSQLSPANCRTSSGLYIGDTACRPNPC